MRLDTRAACCIASFSASRFLCTGVNKDGKLTSIDSYALADTGGYASLGGPVFNLTIEHAGGVYFFPNGNISGQCMYTNAGFPVAFRGFGVPQALFALETQMDEMAHAIGMDRLEFRRINLLEKGQTGAIDNEFPLSIGSHAIVDAMAEGEIYKNKEALINIWVKTGVLKSSFIAL